MDCPEKGLTARGFDQISAKFTGTSVRVTPGEHNLGIFITLEKRDNEQYQLTHPAAHLGGLLRGALSVTVGDICFVTCPKTKIKTILHYKEEGWLGKTQNKVEGVVFRYDPEKDNKTSIKDVPEKDVLARIQGNWKEKVYFSLGAKSVSRLAKQYPAAKANMGLGKPDSPDRSITARCGSQTAPTKRCPASKRISEILVWCDRSHTDKAIFSRHDSETRIGREAEREGERKRGQGNTLEAKILHWSRHASWKARADGRWKRGIRRSASRKFQIERKRSSGSLEYTG